MKGFRRSLPANERSQQNPGRPDLNADLERRAAAKTAIQGVRLVRFGGGAMVYMNGLASTGRGGGGGIGETLVWDRNGHEPATDSEPVVLVFE